MTRPRVGHIQYLNCLPLYYGLAHHHSLQEIELHKGTPTELNEMLLAGQLDVSPVSSIHYLQHAAHYVVLPNLTVSSDGAVQSIILASKCPAAELDGRLVALSNTSATSQVLTQIVLADRYQAQPTYFTCPPDIGRMLDEATAALLIGDPALRLYWQQPAGLHLYDLGAEWKALSGRAMVYAVWAVRRSFAAEHPGLVRSVYTAFQRSLAYGLTHVDTIAADVARWESCSAQALAAYFRALRFSFDRPYRDGLHEFASRASAAGVLKNVPELEFSDLSDR